MSKTAIVYFSSTGNTEAMANAVADGAKKAGADVSVFTSSDFTAAQVADYETLAFGCPAMGNEELEETEFEPLFASCESALAGKRVALFGSYGWGDGEWMRNWEDRVKKDGAELIAAGVMANETPDDDALAECAKLGAML